MERAKEELNLEETEGEYDSAPTDAIERILSSDDAIRYSHYTDDFEVDTVIGAQDNPGYALNELLNQGQANDSFRGAVSYTCEQAGCVWPCDHHFHEELGADFFADISDVALFAGFGCQFCKLFKDIAESRCACMLADRATEKGVELHRCQYLIAKFYNRTLDAVTFTWACQIDIDAEIEVAVVIGSVHLDRLSPETVALYKGWLRHCENFHHSCAGKWEPFAPRRLIDTCDGVELPGVKICQKPERGVQYLALSYCWGGKEPLKTMHHNLRSYEHYIAWAVLPKSYQDTVLLARELGVRYVWIDSLCIVQDDKEEKAAEIARMHDIFRQAFLVIIAAEAESPYSGYLANNPNPGAVHGRVKFCWKDFVVRYRELGLVTVKVRQKLPTHSHQLLDACAGTNTKIGKRAWTYQERLLARRCLIFLGKDVIWECKTGCLCECSGAQITASGKRYEPQLLPILLSARRNRREGGVTDKYFNCARDAHNFWKNAVQSFSRRALSHATDRLPAISALASVIHQDTGDKYLAGLWRGDLAAQLIWFYQPIVDTMEPYSTYVAPSWSWASVAAPTRYFPPRRPHIEQPRYLIEFIDAACTLSGQNPFGSVTDGFLILRAVHCKAHAAISFSPTTGSPNITLELENGTRHSSDQESAEFSFLDGHRVTSWRVLKEPGCHRTVLQRQLKADSGNQQPCSGEVRLLWVEEYVCLILTSSLRVPGAFERIGLLESLMAPQVPAYRPSEIKLV